MQLLIREASAVLNGWARQALGESRLWGSVQLLNLSELEV
ncbi:hypothetical protein Z949_1676 [Sulfitobacter guttiformis KCTC 32187]|nr:hypothetical protein Z949_1676 [Sulfitobacter guttiformis KCTC 32187]